MPELFLFNCLLISEVQFTQLCKWDTVCHCRHPVHTLCALCVWVNQRQSETMHIMFVLSLPPPPPLLLPYRILFSHNSHNIFAVVELSFPHFHIFTFPIGTRDARRYLIQLDSLLADASLWVHRNPLHFPCLSLPLPVSLSRVCACLCLCRNGHIEGY